MINYFRSHLSAKLFISYVAVIMVGVSVLALASKITVPQAFIRHMGMSMGGGAGMMQGNGIVSGMGSDLYKNFQASFNEAILLAASAAGLVALAVGLLLSRSIVAPLRNLTIASRRISDGRYDEQVDDNGSDELGQLARSFNQMAKKLEQVETMRRQLIGDVSHELRTPLTAIKGNMEGLLDGVIPASPEIYQQVHQEAERLARLVEDLQELSRVEAGAYPMDVHPLDIRVLVQTTIKRLSSQTQVKNIQIHTNLPPDLPRVLADSDRITQVLTNLTGNAIQYTPIDGNVTISAARQGNEIYLSVTDTGIGIPAEHLTHLFTRFYRVDKSRSRQSGGGSGIGLTIAKYIVEAHGGQIWVISGGEGQGSTFTFSLPIEK
jgi:signal transduction histidine kinase